MKAKEIIGKSYTLAGSGKEFKILGVEAYPASKVSARFKKILEFKPERVVAISYRGTLIPNITTDDGVIRLKKVEVKGKVFDRPSTISDAIGVKEDMTSYLLMKMR